MGGSQQKPEVKTSSFRGTEEHAVMGRRLLTPGLNVLSGINSHKPQSTHTLPTVGLGPVNIEIDNAWPISKDSTAHKNGTLKKTGLGGNKAALAISTQDFSKWKKRWKIEMIMKSVEVAFLPLLGGGGGVRWGECEAIKWPSRAVTTSTLCTNS